MNVAVAEQRTMAKRKGRPPTERDDIAVRLERKLGSMAKAICTARGIPVAQYLSDLTRAAINRDYAKTLRDAEEQGSSQP